jgi:peptidoglycan/LPS O-acetylase OafA/YrhL/4-amino-4-deoxy-L-arabinose transferase-like glycosyltransferase
VAVPVTTVDGTGTGAEVRPGGTAEAGASGDGPAAGDSGTSELERSGSGAPAEAERERAGGGTGTSRFTWSLVAITLVGLAVRLIYLLVWRHPSEIVGDPYYYHHGANLLADGEGFIHPYRFLLYGDRSPGADHPPGLITILAGFSWLGFRSFFAHQVVGCLLGSLGVAAMGLAGRRIAGERVGLLVAGLTALSPSVFYFDAHVLSETLVVSTTALVLLAAYRWWDRPSVRAAALFGAAIGVAALVRSEALLLGPVIALPLLWWRRRETQWLPQLAAAGAVAAVVIAPWVGYNMARFEKPTTLSAQFDQTLGTANCDDVYYGDRVGYWQLQCIQRVEHLVGEGDASAQGRGFQRIARDYMRDHLDRVPYVVAARVGRTFGVFEPQNQIELDHSVESKEIQLGKAGMFTWWAVGVAGALGLVGLRRARRPIFPLVATVASVAVTVAVIYGNTRFRLPAELALMIPAAVTLDAGLQAAARRWRARRTPAPHPPAANGATAVGAGPAAGRPANGEADAALAESPAGTLGPAEEATAVGAGPAAAGPANGEADASLAASPAGTPGPAGGTRLPDAAVADPPGGLGSSGGHFAGFDGLRAIAALGVLLCHVGLQSGFVGRSGSGEYISRADVGVALFFVLSGFLLYRPFVAARLDGRRQPRTASYLRKRFLRIFPAYWLALTVLVVVLDTRGRHDISGWGDLVIYYGLLQSYSKAHALGGLQQAWTLVNEVAFYLLLPLWAAGAAWLGRRLKPRTAVVTELAVLVAGAAGALGFRWWLHSFQSNDPSIGNFDPRFHWIIANFHMFVPGMALAVALEWSRRRERPLAVLEAARRHPLVCWAVAGAAFWAVATQLDLGVQVGATSQGQAIGKEVLYAAVGFALVVPVALAGATLPRSLQWLGTRAMVTLGVLSYGIYLWHEGVTDLYRDIRNLAPLHGWFAGILVVTTLGSAALAGASYLVVERPALGLKDRHRKLFGSWSPVRLPAGAATPAIAGVTPAAASPANAPEIPETSPA